MNESVNHSMNESLKQGSRKYQAILFEEQATTINPQVKLEKGSLLQPPAPRRGRKEPPKGIPFPASCAAPGQQGAAKRIPFSSLLRRAGAARSRQKGSLLQPPAPRRGRKEPPKGIPFPASCAAPGPPRAAKRDPFTSLWRDPQTGRTEGWGR